MYAELATHPRVEPLRIPLAAPARRRRQRRWVRIVSSIVLGCVVLAVLLVTLGMVLGVERFAVVDSGSMRPALNPGDVAILTSERSSAVADGQIVAFHPPGQPRVTVIHRVRSIERTKTGIIIRTKGDANDVRDPWRAKIAGNTVWRESVKVPWVGFLVAWSQEPYIRMAVLTVMLILLVSVILGWIWRPASR